MREPVLKVASRRVDSVLCVKSLPPFAHGLLSECAEMSKNTFTNVQTSLQIPSRAPPPLYTLRVIHERPEPRGKLCVQLSTFIETLMSLSLKRDLVVEG